MRRTRLAAGPVIQLAGIGARIGHQLLHRLEGRLLRHEQHQRRFNDLADVDQVVPVIPRQLREQQRQHRVGGVCHQESAAVGRRPHHFLGGDRAGRAGLVIDDERLARRLGQLLRDLARGVVRRAARRIRHDQPHGLIGPGGRVARGVDRQAGHAD
ncbi:hypothetical protein G6F65_021915 [Rhizopus arrhizus]|nr:hypothetical protein G6F65_021915 [Rhizopus arrhizus]